MFILLGLLSANPSQAQEAPVPVAEPTEASEAPAPDETQQAEEAEPAEPQPVSFEVGKMNFRSTKVFELPDIELAACAASAPPPTRGVGPMDGQVTLQLTFRRGKLSLVSATHVDTGLAWATPCLKRELAAVEWSIRKGTAELPVTITRPAP